MAFLHSCLVKIIAWELHSRFSTTLTFQTEHYSLSATLQQSHLLVLEVQDLTIMMFYHEMKWTVQLPYVIISPNSVYIYFPGYFYHFTTRIVWY